MAVHRNSLRDPASLSAYVVTVSSIEGALRKLAASGELRREGNGRSTAITD